MEYFVKQLAEIIDAKIQGNSDEIIGKIFYDSRSIIAPVNGVFFAINAIHDGHAYMEDAYQKSIRIFVCNRINIPHEDAVYLLVDNPLESLKKWAKYHLAKYHLPIFGITGSNGKTVVKEWIYQCLWENFNIVRSPKSFNSQMGLPLSLLQINKHHNLGLFEVGISQPGEMEKQEQLLEPEIGILTNVTSAQSQYFIDEEQHITEKIKLFKNAKTIIFNNENEAIEKLIKETYPDKKLISYSGKNADIHCTNKFISATHSNLEIYVYGKELKISIPFTDDASIQNALCVVSVLYYLGFNFEFIQEKIAQIQSVSMRLELIEGLNNSLIISDVFNSDLESLEIALNFLFRQNKTKKNLIVSDIYQSHLPEEVLYEKIAELVNSYPLDQLYLVGEKMGKYKKMFSKQPQTFLTTKEMLEYFENYRFKDAAILVKGARKFELEKVAKIFEIQSHDTILEVNLHSLMTNVNYFKSLLKPETKVIAMVKAQSYGIGSFEVAEMLQYYHVDYLAVAYADEGAYLRDRGIYLPIFVMNPEVSSYDVVIEKRLEPEIYSFRVLEKFIQKLRDKALTNPYPIHIKVDTGMHRLGFQPEDIPKLAELLKNNPFVKVKSVFSHFCVSDDASQEEFTRLQAHKLKTSYDTLVSVIEYKPMLHIDNTTGIVNYPEYQFDAVRVGIGMYGYIDSEKALKNLETVVKLKTVISNVIHIKTGETVGYGRRFKAERETVIATIPVGYADGIRRLVGNEVGYVMIHNQKAKIVGSICMDMMMVDITNIPCREGDEVVVIGEQPSLKEYAEWCTTIPYEILTSISPRVKRVYFRE